MHLHLAVKFTVQRCEPNAEVEEGCPKEVLEEPLANGNGGEGLTVLVAHIRQVGEGIRGLGLGRKRVVVDYDRCICITI